MIEKCPRCEDNAEIENEVIIDSLRRYRYMCPVCGTKGQWFLAFEQDEAIEAWRNGDVDE